MTPTMRLRALSVSVIFAGALALAQTPTPAPPPPAPQAAPQTPPATAPSSDSQQQPQSPSTTPDQTIPAAPAPQTGGTIHGTIKSGTVPLPGVSVTASNSLTGKKYSTTTDITGAYTLVIPQNGRYVLKTELAAFAPVTKDALLNATTHDQAVDFAILLASRAEQQDQQTNLANAARQLLGNGGSQNLNLLGAASDLIQAGAGGGDAGAALPSLASNSDFSSSDSVAVTGQNGTTNPLAGIDFGQMRDNAELNQSLNGAGTGGQGPGGQGGPGGEGGSGGGGGRS